MANEIDAHIGNRLREERLAKGMSLAALAKALGIGFQQIQKYECGNNRIASSRLWGISRVLDVSPEAFFAGLDGCSKAVNDLNLGHGVRLTGRAAEVERVVHELEDDDAKLAFIRLIKAFPRSH